jgi:hypothetical protein
MVHMPQTTVFCSDCFCVLPRLCCTAVAVLCCALHPAAAGLVAWRSRRSTGLRLFAPFIFLMLALITHLALNANNALQVNNRGSRGLRLWSWEGGRDGAAAPKGSGRRGGIVE